MPGMPDPEPVSEVVAKSRRHLARLRFLDTGARARRRLVSHLVFGIIVEEGVRTEDLLARGGNRLVIAQNSAVHLAMISDCLLHQQLPVEVAGDLQVRIAVCHDRSHA